MNVEIQTELLKDCWFCNGTGLERDGKYSFNTEKVCVACAGSKVQATNYGYQVVEFLEKVYGLKPKKDIDGGVNPYYNE